MQMPCDYVFVRHLRALAAAAGSRPVCLQWRFHAIHASVALARMSLRAALQKMGARAQMAKPLLRGVVFDLDGTLTDAWIWLGANVFFLKPTDEKRHAHTHLHPAVSSGWLEHLNPRCKIWISK